MSTLVDIVNAITSTEQVVSDFIQTGIYDFVVKFVAWFVKWSVVAMWKAKLAALEFSWDVAQEIILSLDISNFITSSFGQLDSYTMGMVSFFRIPEAVNLIVSAAVTKFVFKFLGF